MDARDEDRMTPLHYAAGANLDITLVKALIHAGGDPNARDRRDKTPMDYAQNWKLRSFLREHGGRSGRDLK